MAITSYSALWFLPFVLPICFYVMFTDMAQMRITNQAVVVLAGVFVLIGLFAMPSLESYGWRLSHLAVMLLVGIALNAGGVMGAGDAKFIAAAAPFVALEDARTVIALLAATLLAAYVTHRFAKHTPLRRLAPDWVSWDKGKKFPMGLALGATLALYLALGTLFGA
jgi:prepilin peptidase CpaA